MGTMILQVICLVEILISAAFVVGAILGIAQ